MGKTQGLTLNQLCAQAPSELKHKLAIAKFNCLAAVSAALPATSFVLGYWLSWVDHQNMLVTAALVYLALVIALQAIERVGLCLAGWQEHQLTQLRQELDLAPKDEVL